MTKTQRFTLAATSLGLFMIYLDALIVNVALPAIQSDFKVGEAGLQWVVTAYSLGMTIAIMSSGTAADIYGRRKLYLSGIALFTAASAACGMASSVEALNFARAVQGVAAATVNVTSLALVSAAFPDPKLKSWAIGIWTAIASTAIAIGPTLGGFMVQGTGWRSIFMVNIPVGLVAMALTWRFVAESRDERPRTFDIRGQFLFMASVGAFAFAVIEGPHAGWLSGKILTLFVVAGAALAAFIFCERRNADPMMDLKLFGDRTYSLAIITIFAVLFAAYGMLLVITQYMQNVRGFSPTDAGFLLLPYSMSLMIVSLTAGKLVGVIGSRRLILFGVASQIVGFAVLIAGLQGSTVVVTAGLVFVGVGAGLCLTPITSLAMTTVPSRARGNGIGHHERTARAWFHRRVCRARLDPCGNTNDHPQRPPRRRASESGRAQGSRRYDHRKRESPRLLCRDRARPADQTSQPGHAEGDPCSCRQRLHRGYPIQPRNSHSVPRPRPRRRHRLVSPRQRLYRRRRT